MAATTLKTTLALSATLLSVAAAVTDETADNNNNNNLRQQRELRNLVCDPDNCVLASFSFGEGRTECSSCMPENGKWRCPTKGNVFEDGMDATFSGGFGDWSQSQCVHDSYDPSAFAFAGPGAWDDHFVPTCPTAQFCACGDTKDKIEALMFNRESLSATEKNDLYWASMADGYTAVQGFSDVSGGSWEHFDIVYEHDDGRRQFCGGVQSFSYTPQLQHDAGPHTFQPDTYTTSCTWDSAFGGCDEDYDEVSSSYCWWPPAYSETCKPKADAAALVERTGLPAAATQAANTEPRWEEWGSWGSCSASCGGGTRSRTRRQIPGTGSFVDDPALPGAYTETQACNNQACAAPAPSSCSWWQFWC